MNNPNTNILNSGFDVTDLFNTGKKVGWTGTEVDPAAHMDRDTMLHGTGSWKREIAMQERQAQYDIAMSGSAYQRGTADMQKAGLNPAMMYGASGSGASSGSVTGNSAAKYQDKKMADAQINNLNKTGTAALMNATANSFKALKLR